MKALIDMPLSPALVDVFERFGHQAVHADARGRSRAPDAALLALARAEGRVIVTADLDFPRLLALSSASGPGLILFRGGNYAESETVTLLGRVLTTIAPRVIERSICVVDHKRVRITRLPLRAVASSD